VIGVTWYEATAYCAWLTEKLQLDGYAVRLPTEAEWEAAASFDGSPERRPYPWGEEEPTPKRAIYDQSKIGRPAPVGCCPSGAAACGALDLAGNVWEWTASSHKGYPAQSGMLQKDFTDADVPVRGGSWYDESSFVHCGVRDRYHPDYYLFRGVRVCVSPRLAH
jgi:formylglycine-generating enzyme required for sulfatase activity